MSSVQGSPFGGITRVFANKNYFLFFSGQFISLIGTWITMTATSWLVFRLTGSEVLLGLSAFCGQIPTFLLAPFAGVLVDRWNKRTLLIATQCSSMLQSLSLAVLFFNETIGIWSICLLNILQGFINAFDMPSRQAFLNEIIEDRNDLPNAIALNSAMFNGARFIGPPIGGLIISAWGEGYCFFLDAVSYLAVIGSLLMIQVASSRRVMGQYRFVEGLIEGWRYVFYSAPIRELLLLVASICLVGTSYMVLMPIFTETILRGGPSLMGILMAASGSGAVTGALFLATRRSSLGRGRIIVWSGAALGGSLIVFSFSTKIWLSMPLLFIMGASMIMVVASSNMIIQLLSDDDKRGRVMSFYLMAFMGATPVGSLIAGFLAEHIGTTATVALCGVCCLLITARFASKLPALRELIRPIYVQRGIIAEK